MNSQAQMQVRLIDYAKAPLEKLYAAFRTCYSADTPIEIWEKIEAEKISHEKIREFIQQRLKTGHASPLEQVVFWFGIAGVSRSLSHQFVRHRIGISFEQQSQRYVKFKQDKLAFVLPESWRRAGMEDEFSRAAGANLGACTRARSRPESPPRTRASCCPTPRRPIFT